MENTFVIITSKRPRKESPMTKIDPVPEMKVTSKRPIVSTPRVRKEKVSSEENKNTSYMSKYL